MPEGGSGEGDGFSTIAVHAGSEATGAGAPVAGQIFQTTTFVGDPLGEGEVLPSRYGNNQNRRRLVARIVAALEKAEACLVTNSGRAATAALTSVLDPARGAPA
jgi:cystathionine beta-lyase/cystathionine gamma-synthase